MAIILDAFPKLSDTLLSKIGYTNFLNKYSYTDKGVECLLESESTDSANSKMTVVQLTDPVSKWHPEINNLKVDISGSISAPMHLFGPNGIAARDGGILGIAVLWTSKDSSIRGIENVFAFDSKNSIFSFNGDVVFPAHSLRGTLVLQTVIYLKDVGNQARDESHLASVTGTILGVLEETRIIIDGNGSIFPVVEKADKAMPLWWVDCNWEDPTEDLLVDDNFCLYLNTAHTFYPDLNLNNGIQKSPLFQEILASTIGILITAVLTDEAYKDQTISGQNLVPGSVSAAVHYFLKVYDIDPSLVRNHCALARELRKSLMKRF